MAKVAVHGSLSSNSLAFERGVSKVQASAKMKRKTPSELRDEQLKRRCAATGNEPSASLLGTEKNSVGMVSVTKKAGTFKNPRYIDTRVDEVYPVRKSSNRLTMQYLKEIAKSRLASDQSTEQKCSPDASVLNSKSPSLPTCLETSAVLSTSAHDGLAKSCSVTGKSSQSAFHKVSEFSLEFEKSSGSSTTKGISNMEALKTLGARERPAVSNLNTDFPERFGDHSSSYLNSFSTELLIPEHRIPLDFTLKTTMKLISSYSVKWCHRLVNSSDFNGTTDLTSQFGSSGNPNALPSLGYNSTSVSLFSKSLHSWTYPQSSLPASVISALTASAAQGDVDFLLKRQMAWEDSLRNLYYMLRKNRCNIFYVCAPQFAVLFTGGNCTSKKKRTCNAYVSQSTRGLRSLLREHDISFSMPLCNSEAEHASAEDLVELSEIEKGSLGQKRRSVSTSDVKDNSPQSLLAFLGNENVHALYDFLLNYRSFLSLLIGGDVPVLCAPVLFRNASISTPEVKCKELKLANSFPSLPGGQVPEDGDTTTESSPGICYSIEIKDAILPPWVICGICASIAADGKNFEASFTTDPTSFGLNVAHDNASSKSGTLMDLCKEPQESNETFGIPNSAVSPGLRSAPLKSLKFSNGSYTAYLMPL